ncbi:DNA polymerase III subunit gamma/tau [Chitinimonas arctica]|uniref:DNA polymerase III subunit gamma/tau n=1 Tax=Chitinimonas arctica TaxID=2594795 RepID=A0A516SCH2_9NEIS|nr:DNA polymerase III subunit gamma/tau [Chitinimonas arctica]QDQ25840.1 DNA polymerase III subunit gamma/tau [Chitinimonas arctica]
MTYQVLARKWRPRSFATLVGQEHVVKALSNALENQRLHHAYLLTGTRGVGKTTIARILAKSLNCETGLTATPCGVCDACKQIDAGRFVDLLEIDAASNTGIDNIREVLDNAQYSPTQGRFKVYIIDEVHMLSKSAFNAMLKTLEEPPSHVKFILATTDPQKVPVTVLSRCLQFSLRQMLPAQISGHLRHVLEAESVGYEAGALTLLGHAAAGSMRDALSLLDQAIAYGAGTVEEAGVRAMLGAVDQSYLFELLTRLAAQDGAGLMAAAEDLVTRGVGSDAALQELASLLHQLALLQAVPSTISTDHPQYGELNRLVPLFSAEDLQLYYQIALQGRRDLSLAPDEFAGMSMTLLRMLAFAPARKQYVATGPDSSPPPAREALPLPSPGDTGVKTAQTSSAGSDAMAAAPLAIPSPEPEPEPVPAPAPIAETRPTPPWEELPDALETPPVPFVAPVAEVAQEMPEEAPPEAPAEFTGDWAALVGRLKLGGLAVMLAQHAELQSHEGLSFQLAVPDAHKVVAGPDYREKLEQALSQHFGQRAHVTISVGGVSHATPAAQQQRERQARLADAADALNSDPFVQSLIADFGATVLPDTIQTRTDPV